MCVPADEAIGPGDRRIIAELSQARPDAPVLGIVTKTDLAPPGQIAAQLLALSAVRDFADLVPVSAVSDDQVDLLTDLLIGHLPPGPRWYPDGELTDEPIDMRIAELIREAALADVHDELPHSVAVLVDEILPRPEGGLIDVYATIYVERDSQKAIVIGHKGSRLATVGRKARAGIEPLLGSRVYLSTARHGREGLATRPQETSHARVRRVTGSSTVGARRHDRRCAVPVSFERFQSLA